MNIVDCFSRRMVCLLVLCYVIRGARGQDDEEDIAAVQMFELQRVVPNSEQNEVDVKKSTKGKMARQYFEISAGNPFLQVESPGRTREREEGKQEERENVMVWQINPGNPFLQQFLGGPPGNQGIANRGQPEVTTGNPRRTSTQRVTSSPVSRITTTTTTTPASTTYRQIPGLMLYLSPTIEETRRKQANAHHHHHHQHTLHTSRPVLRPPTARPMVTRRTTSSPIIGSFLPKTNPNVVNIFQRAGVEAAKPEEPTGEEPLLSDEEVADIFGNYEAMRLTPKLFVS